MSMHKKILNLEEKLDSLILEIKKLKC